MDINPTYLWTIATGIAAAGAAWGGVKSALNGTRQSIRDLHAEHRLLAQAIQEHTDEEHEHVAEANNRIGRIEGKLDLLTHMVQKQGRE